jgi:hypothetical protein
MSKVIAAACKKKEMCNSLPTIHAGAKIMTSAPAEKSRTHESQRSDVVSARRIV